LVVHHRDPFVASLVFGMLAERFDPKQGTRVDTLGDLAAEQRVEAP
jgi:hypothetical protein